jgi:hypothetical protein
MSLREEEEKENRMMTYHSRRAVAVLTALTAFMVCSKNAKISGIVTDIMTGKPVLGALVKVDVASRGITATTDKAGHFVLKNVPPGSYAVTTFKDGYTSVSDSVIAGEKAAVITDTLWIISPPKEGAGVYVCDGDEPRQIGPPAAGADRLNTSPGPTGSYGFSETKAPKALFFYAQSGEHSVYSIDLQSQVILWSELRAWSVQAQMPMKVQNVGNCTVLIPNGPLEEGFYAACWERQATEWSVERRLYPFRVVKNLEYQIIPLESDE